MYTYSYLDTVDWSYSDVVYVRTNLASEPTLSDNVHLRLVPMATIIHVHVYIPVTCMTYSETSLYNQEYSWYNGHHWYQ